MQSSPTIVIADADEEVRLTLCESVARADPRATVIEASDGMELDRALKRGGIDILFVDVVLPMTNGADVLGWRAAAGQNSLIVLVSDLLAPGWPSVAKKIGAYDVILKPLGDHHIRRVVEASRILRRRLNLLVVDPGRETRSLIQRLLRRSQFSLNIREAEGGHTAVGLVRRQDFDLAIIAMECTDHPALEVACRINDLRPQTKIVLIGRAIEPAVMKQLGTFGVSTFLRKPFGFAEIDRMLHEVFGLWRPYLLNALQMEERRLLGLPEEERDGAIGKSA